MNKLPMLIAGGLALATVAAATSAGAAEERDNWVQSPQTAYYPPALKAPGYGTAFAKPSTAAVGEVGQVADIAGQTWQVQPTTPIYSPGFVDHNPLTGRGGLENNMAG